MKNQSLRIITLAQLEAGFDVRWESGRENHYEFVVTRELTPDTFEVREPEFFVDGHFIANAATERYQRTAQHAG